MKTENFNTWFEVQKINTKLYAQLEQYRSLFKECWDYAQDSFKEHNDYEEESIEKLKDRIGELEDA